MSPDEVREQLELQIVELIKAKLADGSMTEERAQQISQVVLDTVKPGMNFEDLYKAIPKLDDTCQELSGIILPFLRDYEENVNKKALSQIEDMIHLGQYDAAANLGKQVVDQEIKLEWQGSGKPASAKTEKAMVGEPASAKTDRATAGEPTPVKTSNDKAGTPQSTTESAQTPPATPPVQPHTATGIS